MGLCQVPIAWSPAALPFDEATRKYIEGHKPGWRNAMHAAQWESTLATYAHPVIGALSVQAIDTALVLKVLEPIWTAKPETASRLRGRIESVPDWAKVRGYCKGENPARSRGHLDKLLPARSKVRRVEHRAALAHTDMPDFMEATRTARGTKMRQGPMRRNAIACMAKKCHRQQARTLHCASTNF